MTRERPKETPKAEPTKKKVLTVDTMSGRFSALIKGLLKGSGGHSVPAFHHFRASRTIPQHANDFFAEKREGKHGGFKDWELNKIWAPKKDKDGGIFLAKSQDSRQQKRRRQFGEAYAYMAEHFGPEPRAIRRSMARDKTRLFWKVERETEGVKS